MAHLDLLPAGAAQRNFDRALHQRSDQCSFVFRRTSHVGLRIGGGPRGFDRSCNRLFVIALPAQGCLGRLWL